MRELPQIIKQANDFILKNEIHALPLGIDELAKICESLGFKLRSYNQSVKLIDALDVRELTEYEAFTHRSEHAQIIFFRDGLSNGFRNFVIAHEIGHIVLKHCYCGSVGYTNADNEQEREANTFALQLLAPLCILHTLGITGTRDIQTETLLDYKRAKVVHKALQRYREQPRADELMKAYGIRLPKKQFDISTVLILLTALLLTVAIFVRELPDSSRQPLETTSNFFAELKEKYQPQAEVTLPIKTEAPQTTAATLTQSETVYITRSGERYHKQNCYHIKNSTTTALSIFEAIEDGYTACKSCYK